MNVDGRLMRTIWLAEDGQPRGAVVEIIDQTRLPHELVITRLARLVDAANAIRDMQVRGAPLIGATAAYGLALAARVDPSEEALDRAQALLAAARPTAVNLRWALERIRQALANQPLAERAVIAYREAAAVCEEDIAINHAIGEHGLPLIEKAASGKGSGEPVNILTHCNAGWLATVDWGTAT